MNKENDCVENIKECDYKGEHYSARTDGYVYRHTPEGKKARKLDNKWTLGRKDPKNGYMYIGDARIHIIIANAFLGKHDSKVYVVDHIDTNRCNNRIENLRWLTRLENTLNNETTRKKIELICGSVEAFLNNPSLLRGHEMADHNFEWMKNVTPEEAQNCKEHWENWVRTVKPKENYKKGNIGDWIYKKPTPYEQYLKQENSHTSSHNMQKHLDAFHKTLSESKNYSYPMSQYQSTYGENETSKSKDYPSLTKNAKQRDWRTPTEFPCCPSKISEHPLDLYLENLSKGKIFSKNQYGSQPVIKAGFDKEHKHLFVLSKLKEDSMKSCALTCITFENGLFVHENRHTFFQEDGGLKYYTLAIGKEWTGGDVMDDYC